MIRPLTLLAAPLLFCAATAASAAPGNDRAADIAAIKEGRRDFLRKAFVTASAAMAAPGLARAADGDPNILSLPPWTTSLGQPVAARGDSGWYLLAKTLRRYRVPVTVAAALAAGWSARAALSVDAVRAVKEDV